MGDLLPHGWDGWDLALFLLRFDHAFLHQQDRSLSPVLLDTVTHNSQCQNIAQAPVNIAFTYWFISSQSHVIGSGGGRDHDDCRGVDSLNIASFGDIFMWNGGL
ncbi:hypothetical protein CC2G_012650 [Coprinopsis cinerea AmutBmut pab1-1]|nr:hypothetical protein CC2G_012650 [Coprinopsis cinerea AmutBmut pab1-1]